MREVKPDSKRKAYEALHAALDAKGIGSLFDNMVARTFSSHLASGDRAIDAGAYHGRQVMAMAKAVGPRGSVWAFEPLEAAFTSLMGHIRKRNLSGCVEARQVVLLDRGGEVDYYQVNEAPGRSGLVWAGSPSQVAGTFTVTEKRMPAARLDEVLNDGEPVRLIHLDLAGGELPALNGATGLLARQRPLLIFGNSRAAAAAMHQYSPEDFCGFFDAAGYELYNMLGFRFQVSDWKTGKQPSWYLGVPAEDEVSKGTLQGMIDDVMEQQGLSSVFD
jgi:FkbM family methyltransferase